MPKLALPKMAVRGGGWSDCQGRTEVGAQSIKSDPRFSICRWREAMAFVRTRIHAATDIELALLPGTACLCGKDSLYSV